jgi:TfoX/Sxy family transcriptional regulator of competence genes
MKLEKSPQELIELFESVQPGPPAQARQMFGYPACFVNGNMFMGLHADRFIVRLPEDERAKLTTAGGTAFEPMPGRPMKEYVVLPEAVLKDKRKLKTWIGKALAYGSSLPPKAPKNNK